MKSANRKLFTVLIVVTGLYVIALAKPLCSVGTQGHRTPCYTMCADAAGGDPNGTEAADCQDCCHQMGMDNQQCYANCDLLSLPCACPKPLPPP